MEWHTRLLRPRTLAFAVVAVALVGSACEYGPAWFAGTPALSECNGVPATIGVGWRKADGEHGRTYNGTEGDDVVVITNGPVEFHGLGGDDLICINDTGMASGEPIPPSYLEPARLVRVFGGVGDDIVHNFADLSPIDQDGYPVEPVLVDLGGGNNEFHGDDTSEWVETGGWDLIDTAGGDDSVVDSGGRDEIHLGDGDDHFYTIDGNADVVDGGDGYDRHYFGRWGAGDTDDLTGFEEGPILGWPYNPR